MKKINKKKIVLAIGLVLTLSTSQAQWATFNISDALYDYFRSMRDYVMNSNLQVISNGQQLQMAQAAQNVVNSDYRNRLSTVYNNILQEDEKTRPTYQLCAELSKGQVGISTISASLTGVGGRGSSRGAGGGGGGRSKGSDPAPAKHYNIEQTTTIQENIRSTENAQAMVLNNIIDAKTCDKRYGDKLCGSEGEFALADVSVFGLLSNSSKNDKVGGSGLNFANYTMESAAYKAGLQYINVATLSRAPKYPDPSEIQKNPGYVAMYNSMIIKLNAAGESLKSMLDLRKAPLAVSAAVTAVWNSPENSSDWGIMFPTLKKPAAPSFYEFLNYRINADVFGPATIAKASTGNDGETLKGIQAKIALNNLIGLQQYNQQEKTNILLSHILVQLTTPADKDVLDREYQKFLQQ